MVSLEDQWESRLWVIVKTCVIAVQYQDSFILIANLTKMRGQERGVRKFRESHFKWQNILLTELFIPCRPKEVLNIQRKSTCNHKTQLCKEPIFQMSWCKVLKCSVEKVESFWTVSWFFTHAELSFLTRLSNPSWTLKILWRSSKKIYAISRILVL